MTSAPDWVNFKAAIDGVRCHDEHDYRLARSRDYYWYSPILKEQLDGAIADLVVVPADTDEVVKVASAAARFRVPLTPRGGGTGNYGQCVPLEGGVVLDLTRLDRVLSIEPGACRVEAGARISRIDDAARETAQELLMYPSTRQMATIGGFIAGGSGGVGSLRHGMLRDPGNLDYLKVVTVEPEPRQITLTGAAIDRVHHAYGTNGIIVEVGLPLTPATDWVHAAALFDGYDTALTFAATAQQEGLECYLLTVVERRFSEFYTKMDDRFPADRDAVFAMVAPEAMDVFSALVSRFDGRVSMAMNKPDLRAAGLQPAYECAWNHTTLQALKVDKGWTYLQVAYPDPFDPALVMDQMSRYGDGIYWHHEMARMGGHIQIFALPLVRYRGRDALYELIAELETRDGCTIYDPHVITIEDGGMKQVDTGQIAFKRDADPYGLMNPGKTRGWTADMARRD
jgi:FAD/FMN-containing dehydrogenase